MNKNSFGSGPSHFVSFFLASSRLLGPLLLAFSRDKGICSNPRERKIRGREEKEQARRGMRTGMRRTTHSVAFGARIKLHSQPFASE